MASASLLLGLLPPAPALAATNQRNATATGGTVAGGAPAADDVGPARIALTGFTPMIPDEGDTLTVSGTVTNTGKTPLTAVEAGLHTGPRLKTRSSIEQAAGRKGFDDSLDGSPVTAGAGSTEIEDIPAGTSRSFTMELPVEELDLGADGVYQLGVAVRGRTHSAPYDHTLGIARTFLPWQTETAAERTRISYLWPLISDSHLTARTESDELQTPIFRNDDLAAEIAPGGRLRQLVSLGSELPVSWVIDPDLLASVDAMAGAYLVQTEDGPVPGTGQENAKRLLRDLQQAVEDAEVIALPFGDPDLASLAHRGRSVSGSLSYLGPATEVATKTVEMVLNTTPNTDFAWPVEGAVDPSIVSVATSAGARKVIVRSDSLRESRDLPHTPNAARPIGGGTTALSADAALSTLFEGDMSHADASVAAGQQFLAQTLSVTEQDPSEQRSIVIAPQRRPSGSQAATMAAAVRTLEENSRWTEFVDLAEAAKATPDPSANRKVPGPGAYPDRLRDEELGTETFEDIRHTQSTLESFQVILSEDDRVVTPFGNAIRRELSTAWRGRPEAAEEYRDSVQDHLVGLTEGVSLVEKSPMTLSGRSATIPVTVQNNLVQKVDGLELRLTSGRRIGLEIKEDSRQVIVEGGHSQSVKFDTTANANGRTWVEAQLYTADGKRYGEPMQFYVDVTEITSTVLLVIAGGMLLVVLAGVRMYTQRKRREPQADPDTPLDEDAEASGADGPEEPDGPHAEAAAGNESGSARPSGDGASGAAVPKDSRDTGPESGDSSGPGEKVDC